MGRILTAALAIGAAFWRSSLKPMVLNGVCAGFMQRTPAAMAGRKQSARHHVIKWGK